MEKHKQKAPYLSFCLLNSTTLRTAYLLNNIVPVLVVHTVLQLCHSPSVYLFSTGTITAKFPRRTPISSVVNRAPFCPDSGSVSVHHHPESLKGDPPIRQRHTKPHEKDFLCKLLTGRALQTSAASVFMCCIYSWQKINVHLQHSSHSPNRANWLWGVCWSHSEGLGSSTSCAFFCGSFAPLYTYNLLPLQDKQGFKI